MKRGMEGEAQGALNQALRNELLGAELSNGEIEELLDGLFAPFEKNRRMLCIKEAAARFLLSCGAADSDQKSR